MQLNAPAWKPVDRIPRGGDTLEVVEVRQAVPQDSRPPHFRGDEAVPTFGGQLARSEEEVMSRSQLNDSKPSPSVGRLAARYAALSSLIVTVSIVVWAVSTDASGYFWPGWAAVVALYVFIARVGRAALGDAEEIHKLQLHLGGAR
jgi:hypothetical protein